LKQKPPAQLASLAQSTRGTQVREVTEQTEPASQSASLSQPPVATHRPPTH
jgi:hypothetical protein